MTREPSPEERHSLLDRITGPLRRLRTARAKRAEELGHWRWRKDEEGELDNAHYEWFYTEHFGLSRDDYAGKRVLDIGCGPRGSLEWADRAAERVGLDPLAADYLKLGAAEHRMTYVTGSAEEIPYDDGHFDIVASINSLDHVDDAERAIAEIGRVAAPGALLLLIVEINHTPRASEPQRFHWTVLDRFRPRWKVLAEHHYAEAPGHWLLSDVKRGVPYDHDDESQPAGILSAMLERT